ncbi:hypothetical protein [Saccharothrix sp. ST-888]|uniref:hypothetical protein n=1 Tax=Saccharothrix sp. ST-888 TaxID=1427391 RepID=UPI0005EC9DE7|nr:hypothetical protein [Saccharothrix sp. ST-888]KJK56102.1 hypothetical protein UK12_24485 [Saccharothrix sp. ST-888]
MVQLTIPACVSCAKFGDAVAAEEHHTISFDRGEHLEVSFCKPCYRAHYAKLRALVEVEVDEPAGADGSIPGVPRVVREAIAAGLAAQEAMSAVDIDPQPTLPLAELLLKLDEEPSQPERVFILCRDCDPEEQVGYSRRNDHARRHGKSAQEILWTMPDGAPLPHACQAHPGCEEVGFGYMTERGLINHLKGLAPPPHKAKDTTKTISERSSATSRAKPAKKGAKKEGVPQVVCPEQHAKGSAEPFWVEIRNRQSHAKERHSVDAPYIAWENPDSVGLPVLCQEHQVCAMVGGFPFPSEQSQHMHSIKSQRWEKAEQPQAV